MLRKSDQGLDSISVNLLTFIEKSQLSYPLNWINASYTWESLSKLLKEKNAKYHKTCYSRYNAQKLARLRDGSNDKNSLACSKSKRKISVSSAPECAFCGQAEKKLSKMTPKVKKLHRLHAAGELHSSHNKTNSGHVENLTSEWRKMASVLGDSGLLSKLDADVRANELIYHGNCLKTFKFRYQKCLENVDKKTEKEMNYYLNAVALDRTIRHLKERAYDQPESPVTVSSIMEKLNSYIEKEGLPHENHITRFGELILAHAKQFKINKNKHGLNVFTLKDEYVKATEVDSNFDSSMKFLNNASKVVSTIRSLINKTKLKFDATFDQINSVPQELISLIGLLTGGDSSPLSPSQSTLTISQMIVYNFKKTKRKNEILTASLAKSQFTKHETPIITYTSLKLYSCVRSKNLLQKLHQIGICTSYNRVIQLLSEWASNSLAVYKQNDQVIPLNLRKDVFTVFTKDNIDKNSSSNNATKHFHGTSICAFQCLKSIDDGVKRENNNVAFDTQPLHGDYSLPLAYTNVKSTSVNHKTYSYPVPSVNVPDNICNESLLQNSRTEEIDWLEFVLSTKSADKKSWSSYHVTKQVDTIPTPCNKPLLKDVVHTFDMQHHLISLFIEYTAVINPNQVASVDCSDQPIYALSKINQWLFPKFAPPKYFPIFGGLHIEKALLTSHGLLIGGSGLEDILGDKQIETIGLQTADVDINHIHKGRYAIQLSSTAIFACLKAAYTQSQSDNPLLDWANEMAKQNLMFRYWFIILNFQIDYLVFVKSLREGKFLLFINVLKSLIKWFFIFDQYNYSRWISVHVQYLLTLPVTCPELYQEFLMVIL